MKISSYKLLFSLLFLFLSLGCKKDKSCAYFLEASPRYMFAPDSAMTGSLITVTISYSKQLSCQQFHSFLSNTIDSTTTISMQTEVDECDCQNELDHQYKYFQYQAPLTPGHSIIRIHVVDNVFYSDTIVVY
jgi:hypothetical protein